MRAERAILENKSSKRYSISVFTAVLHMQVLLRAHRFRNIKIQLSNIHTCTSITTVKFKKLYSHEYENISRHAHIHVQMLPIDSNS